MILNRRATLAMLSAVATPSKLGATAQTEVRGMRIDRDLPIPMNDRLALRADVVLAETISQYMQRLEDRLHTDLFERHARGARLTHAGFTCGCVEYRAPA